MRIQRVLNLMAEDERIKKAMTPCINHSPSNELTNVDDNRFGVIPQASGRDPAKGRSPSPNAYICL